MAQVPEPGDVHGMYEAEFVGPPWLQALARVGLGVVGESGFWGKWFDDGSGCNLFDSRQGPSKRIPFKIERRRSGMVPGDALCLSYAGQPFPWSLVCGELRQHESTSGVLFGYVRLANMSGGGVLGLPYLLHHRPDLSPAL